MPISIFKSSNFYRKILSAGIDSPIAGLTANDSTKLIFSTMTPDGICCNGDSSTDPVNPVFTRSTTCWAKNIDTSPISPWNNGGGYPAPNHAGGFGGTGTLISPRHIVYCNHFQIKIGKKLIFVDMNNNCYIRTISNSLQLGSTDIQIGLLDSDLPSSVSFCKVASFDLTTITDTNNRVAALYLDQERKALVGDYFNSVSAGSLNISTNSQRANFYELPIGGDSACPINFVYNNKIILLFLFTSPTGGQSIPYNIVGINSVMTTLGGGYTLSLFNKEDVVSQEKNFSIKKQNTGNGKLISRKFTPKDITSLALWLTSDAGVTLNNNYVTLWEDQSGNNRNFENPQNLGIGSTGLPTFNNGALYFTSLQPYEDINASILAMQSGLLNFTTPYTLFHVFRKIGTFTGLSKSGNTAKRRKYQFGASSNTYYALEGNTDTLISYFDLADNINTKRLFCQKFNSNNSGALRYNGVQVSSGSDNYSIDQTNSNPVFIGASPFNLNIPGYNAEACTEAYIYEIIFYNKALADTEIYKIETYLNKKYSIY